MKKVFLPTITKQELKDASDDVWDYLLLFVDKYEEYLDSKSGNGKLDNLSKEQQALIRFNYLCGQIDNGGFIQLIVNGYGKEIFLSTFSEDILKFGAKKVSNLVDKTKPLYEKHKTEMEKKLSAKKFSELYQKFTEFEELDVLFYEFNESEAKKVKSYVKNNLKLFATVN